MDKNDYVLELHRLRGGPFSCLETHHLCGGSTVISKMDIK